MDAVLQSVVFLGAARVTAAYAIMFASLIIWQGVSKLRIAAACAKTKETFSRYNDTRMLPYDRTIGNLVEWAVPFLCLFWLRYGVLAGSSGSTARVMPMSRRLLAQHRARRNTHTPLSHTPEQLCCLLPVCCRP